jgi:DNA repair protein RadA/Sms
VGLSGEIRAVNRIEQRIAEAEKLGFEKIIVSRYNLGGGRKGKSKLNTKEYKIEIIEMGRVDELYKYLF